MGDDTRVDAVDTLESASTAKIIADGKIPKQTKAAKKAVAVKFEERGAFEEVNVLVTGFGVFDDMVNGNPSWFIARSLPPMLECNAAHPSRIRISVYPDPVPVAYNDINELAAEAYGITFPVHLWLHIGTSDRNEFYAVEKAAHRDGYQTPDERDKLPDSKKQPPYWTSTNESLETTASLPDVLARWRGTCPDEDLRVSENAGRYVCEYQLYASLAHMSHIRNAELPWKERTMVSFLHVPRHIDRGSIEKGCEITIGLIYALIDSRRFRDGDYEPGSNAMAPA